MSQPPRSTRPNEIGRYGPVPPIVDSVTLMGGRRELIIRTAPIRMSAITASKLILTK
jgi:hemin uptake protein HemP